MKRLPLRWSRKALDSLDEGLSCIAQFNPDATHQLQVSILNALEHVREFPQAARVVPEEGNSLIREALLPPFRTMYEIHPRELRILVASKDGTRSG